MDSCPFSKLIDQKIILLHSDQRTHRILYDAAAGTFRLNYFLPSSVPVEAFLLRTSFIALAVPNY